MKECERRPQCPLESLDSGAVRAICSPAGILSDPRGSISPTRTLGKTAFIALILLAASEAIYPLSRNNGLLAPILKRTAARPWRDILDLRHPCGCVAPRVPVLAPLNLLP